MCGPHSPSVLPKGGKPPLEIFVKKILPPLGQNPIRGELTEKISAPLCKKG